VNRAVNKAKLEPTKLQWKIKTNVLISSSLVDRMIGAVSNIDG
jgi:hypothetical protein